MPGGRDPLLTRYDVGDEPPGDRQLVARSDSLGRYRWVERHLDVCILGGPSSLYRWVNMPATGTLLFGGGHHIVRADLTSYEQVRLLVNKQATAGNAGSKLSLYYKTGSYSTVLLNYAIIGTSAVEVAIDTTNDLLNSGWIDLAAGAKADALLAIIGSGGDGAIDPEFGAIHAQFR
jgi:hypothetical protein